MFLRKEHCSEHASVFALSKRHILHYVRGSQNGHGSFIPWVPRCKLHLLLKILLTFPQLPQFMNSLLFFCVKCSDNEVSFTE